MNLENHVPSLETCKRMKELGWIKECLFQWGRYYDWQWDAFGESTDKKKYDEDYEVEMADNLPDHLYFEKESQAQLLSEILEELPENIKFGGVTYGLQLYKNDEGYYIEYIQWLNDQAHRHCFSLSSAEAAALLWIKLREEGIIPSNA